MSDLKDAWKSAEVFKKQLAWNLNELESSESYAPHWKQCIALIKQFKPLNVLDLGCGCGAMSEVFLRELPDVKYTGMDYSKDAIELAKKTWKSNNFFVKNVMDLDEHDVSKYDLLFAGALFDVMPNGDEAMEHVMKLGSDSLLLSRMKLTLQESFYTTYRAYELIETCAFHHNRDNFVALCEKYSYNIHPLDDNIYLVKNDKPF